MSAIPHQDRQRVAAALRGIVRGIEISLARFATVLRRAAATSDFGNRSIAEFDRPAIDALGDRCETPVAVTGRVVSPGIRHDTRVRSGSTLLAE